ncbi:MAG: DUF5313 family protein, partial [Actinomycetota bacterium]
MARRPVWLSARPGHRREPSRAPSRWLLGAWPVADREARGEEIVGTTLDLVPPGKAWLPLPLALSLLSGGLRSRWYHHPPLWRWYLYGWGLKPLPWEWQSWVRNDLTGRGWRLRLVGRRLGVVMASIMMFWALLNQRSLLPHSHPGLSHPVLQLGLGLAILLAGFVLAILICYPIAATVRGKQFMAHGLDADGSPDPAGSWAWRADRPLVPNTSLPACLVAFGVGAAVPTLLLHEPPVSQAAHDVASVIGLLT